MERPLALMEVCGVVGSDQRDPLGAGASPPVVELAV
jgi:hypothetical protein